MLQPWNILENERTISKKQDKYPKSTLIWITFRTGDKSIVKHSDRTMLNSNIHIDAMIYK